MSYKMVFFVVIFAGVSVIAAMSPSAPAEYWISFVPFNERTEETGRPSLMKIDVFGNVLIPPMKVVPAGMNHKTPIYGATALSPMGRFLVLWIPDGHFTHLPQYRVFRAVIDKRTLRLVSLRDTSLLVHNPYALQVTQKKQNNFLVAQKIVSSERRYFGIPLSPRNKLLPGSVHLSSDPGDCTCEMGISSDGRIFFFTDRIRPNRQRILLQHLNHKGKPVADPVIQSQGIVWPADMTNIISNNRRFGLFRRGLSLYIQPLNNETLQSAGPEVKVATDVFFNGQVAVIDPHGRFIVYATQSKMLTYQALDALGRKSEEPKVLAENVLTGLDILQD